MPSLSLLRWQNDRMVRLARIDAQCAASLATTPPDAQLVEENLRGYVLAVSAHFQGFCRDLYTEASLIMVSKVGRPALEIVFQAQFAAHRKLDRGNPNLANLKADFKRLGFPLDLPGADPANVARLADLARLNEWRNVAAHQGTPTASAGPLALPLLRAWRNSCSDLAISLDGILYNELRRILRRRPW